MVKLSERVLNRRFAALADPTRRAMIERLSKGRATISYVAKPFIGRMSLPAVTKHIKVLEDAGLIIKTREAQTRPCEVNGPALREVTDWIAQYRATWEQAFDSLDACLKSNPK
jgi:DNA-binding transcriptional ArsR family regulator